MKIERRIFVVGVPRSGTTLVQSLLASHSAMTSFTESHFFSRHFSFLPLTSRPILTKHPGPRLHQFLAENDEEPPGTAGWFDAGALRSRALLPLLTRPVARQLLKVLDELTLRRGKSIWVEKTPRHLRYVPFLNKVSGGQVRTDFVHVIRGGLEVVASLHRASQNWERPYDLESCVRRWNEGVSSSVCRIGAPADHFVMYEELASRPEAALGNLLEGLGLGWEPDILERYAHTTELLVTREETWKEGVGRGIRPSGTSSRTLSAEQQEQATNALRHGLYARILNRRRMVGGD